MDFITGSTGHALAAGPTAWLANRVADMDDKQLTAERMEQIRFRTLDLAGCIIGALHTVQARAIRHIVAYEGGVPRCTAFGLKEKTALGSAGFYNAVLGHVLEYDDSSKISIAHPAVAVIPAALAVAEAEHLSFQAYAMAVMAGYEVMIRLGAALNPELYEHWHTTSVCGTFAAMATAGKLWGFDVQTFIRGFGLCASAASGLTAAFGTDGKLFNIGNAVRCGLLAAQLAREGFSAPDAVIEQAGGIAESVGVPIHGQYLDGCSDTWMIDEATYKIHASCGHTHPAVDAFLSLRAEHGFCGKDIASISVETYARAVKLVGEFHGTIPAEAKFSIPYCLAAAAVRGKVSLEEFSSETMALPEIQQLAQRVMVVEDTGSTARYPAERRTTVTVTLLHGEVFRRQVVLPEGNPSAEYLTQKYLTLSAQAISKSSAENIMRHILSIKADIDMGEHIQILGREIYDGKLYD